MLALVLGMSVHAATGHDPLVGPTSSDDGLHHVPTAGRFFFSSPTRSSPSRFVSSPPLRLFLSFPIRFSPGSCWDHLGSVANRRRRRLVTPPVVMVAGVMWPGGVGCRSVG